MAVIDQVAIGVAAVSLLRRRAPVSPQNSFWEEVRAVAPPAVWAYFGQIDAELAATIRNTRSGTSDTWPGASVNNGQLSDFHTRIQNLESEETNNSDAWLKRRHPAAADVLEGLERAVSIKNGHLAEIDNRDATSSRNGKVAEIANRLRYIQGWVIQWATARLGMAYATERPGAGVTTSTVIDRVVQERAAFDLLGWTIAESYRQWSQPERFVEQWRVVTSGNNVDRDMLRKAALFDAELALLDAEGER